MNTSSGKPKPIRVAIYTRKSVADDERKEFGSIEAQRKACEAFILSRAGLGWTAIEKHYDDYGFSGKDLNRDAFKSLVADCEAGLIDHVCCYRLDRLSRSPRDFADMNDKFICGSFSSRISRMTSLLRQVSSTVSASSASMLSKKLELKLNSREKV